MKTRITNARKALGLTQEQLGEKTGVTRQTIIALEQEKYNPSLELAFRITKALKKKRVEELFEL